MGQVLKRKSLCMNQNINMYFDAPPNSLKDPYANPKVKTMKDERIGVSSLVHNTLGGKKGVLELQDGD